MSINILESLFVNFISATPFFWNLRFFPLKSECLDLKKKNLDLRPTSTTETTATTTTAPQNVQIFVTKCARHVFWREGVWEDYKNANQNIPVWRAKIKQQRMENKNNWPFIHFINWKKSRFTGSRIKNRLAFCIENWWTNEKGNESSRHTPVCWMQYAQYKRIFRG